MSEAVDKKYLKWIKKYPLRPIRSEEENDYAGMVCDELLDNYDVLNDAEKDYLEVLSTLVESFESQWKEEEEVTPRSLLLYLMERNGLNQTDLIPEFGSSSRASEYFSGKRKLSMAQIQKLANRFKLSPNAFIEK
ncbi:transcriptional regulator [bacterium]|nr:transcriptional regulator [bacterium]QQR59884.1 MAG: transcriptional regulator [Candidatus Melainabacteria bacterium]